ncbi:YVTN repeat-like/Quino protein amine dehydrogenase [Suillus brevipes Sb2]|nr:YVTN repeat-like/Quino protein amine dehydrogenase [Suillus brevipes Sb2]
MASTSTQPVATADKSILTPVMTLEGHEPWNHSTWEGKQHEFKDITCFSYFPDGKEMISGSRDQTIRRWDLRKGKEIEKVRQVFEGVREVGVSKDGRWIVIASGEGMKVSEVETGIVRTFHEGDGIYYIDISADSTLLAGGCRKYSAVWIWNLDTGELVAGPFHIGSDIVPEAVRLSGDSCKLAVSSFDWKQRQLTGRPIASHSLQVWDVQTQKLNVQTSTRYDVTSNIPIFWTTNDNSIVAALFDSMIYEYNASTLKTVGAPFNHTSPINSLALSSDCRLLASACNRTIKLWAFESRQLLASFDVEPVALIFSPDSRQLAYTTYNKANIYICNIPVNILANIESPCKSKHPDLLNVRDPPFPSFTPFHFLL